MEYSLKDVATGEHAQAPPSGLLSKSIQENISIQPVEFADETPTSDEEFEDISLRIASSLEKIC